MYMYMCMYSFVACLFVSWDESFLGFFLLLSVSLLVCYTHISIYLAGNYIHVLLLCTPDQCTMYVINRHVHVHVYTLYMYCTCVINTPIPSTVPTMYMYLLVILNCRFHIQNLNKQSRLYQQRMVPFVRTVPGKSTWDRLKDNVEWQVKTIVQLIILLYT